jgi:glucose-1-phosphatase
VSGVFRLTPFLQTPFTPLMNFKALIFDFGNVIINIDVPLVFKEFAKISGKNATCIEQLFAENQLFRRYETGQFTDDEFREIVRQTIGFPFSDKQVDDTWNALLLDIPQERIDLLKKLRRKYPIYLLSNTSSIHIIQSNKYIKEKFGINGLADIFDKPFLSYEMEMWKPDDEIYLTVLKEIGMKPHEVVFLDDNTFNIEAAKNLGIQTILVNPNDKNHWFKDLLT